MSRVIAIVNWTRFQHYKDRDPPWVKFYRDTLSTEAWVLGTDKSRLLQAASLLLAARYHNATPLNWEFVCEVAHLKLTEAEFTASVRHLVKHKFFEIREVADEETNSDSDLLAKCSSETESEAESEKTYTHISEAPRRQQSASTAPAVPREAPPADDFSDRLGFERVSLSYPKYTGAKNDIAFERNCRRLIAEQGETWDSLEAHAERFAAYCKAGGVSGPAYVRAPYKHFDPNDLARYWAQPWEAPAPKETKEDAAKRRQSERATADAEKLKGLMADRASRGVPGFRDPHPHESPEAYETAMRLEFQHNRRSTPAAATRDVGRAIGSLAISKRLR